MADAVSDHLAELWRGHMVNARWFQSKGLPIHSLTITPLPWHTQTGSVWVRSELAEVAVGDSEETYHLLTGYLPVGAAEPDAFIGQAELPDRGLVDVVDAPRSPHTMAALLACLTQPQTTGMTWFSSPPEPNSPTAVFAGEQSNTTVQVGSDMQFKVFRKITTGPNREEEMLAGLQKSGITPHLIGTLTGADGEVTLGIFEEHIQQASDGWDYCVRACRAERSISDEMTRLGNTLRLLHTELVDAFGSSTIDGAAIGAQMLARLDAASEQVPELVNNRQALRAILDVEAGSVPVQRIHGDFHLGQALITPDGWTIIDFEGEPIKTPEQRAAPDSPWRDVAGLLRSLDYARHYHDDPEGTSAKSWYSDARRAFLASYLGDEAMPRQLLRAYEVDKAIYELVYETRNRPTWAGIPRHAIEEAITAS
ncbi:MAG: phosphotransferase [Propionibacteriaceae bacterium]|nr:phosphotransferase [Propionibacteriaceae bacterium]